MTEKNKEILINRIKSLFWRAGMMMVVLAINFILVNLELLNIPSEMIVVIGLILGEISKYLNIDLRK